MGRARSAGEKLDLVRVRAERGRKFRFSGASARSAGENLDLVSVRAERGRKFRFSGARAERGIKFRFSVYDAYDVHKVYGVERLWT